MVREGALYGNPYLLKVLVLTMRAYQGRSFAWQEIIIAVSTIFQRFDLVLADDSYSLRVKQTLTLKPDGFIIHAIPRANIPPFAMGVQGPSIPRRQSTQNSTVSGTVKEPKDGMYAKRRLNVLYGSNTGTCEAFAQRIASAASSKGESIRFLPHISFILEIRGFTDSIRFRC